MLERFAGKGGCTYARIPEILPDKQAHFGWVRVRGTIDSVEISKYHLMPMGNGFLFLPVKAAIRKKIAKQAGDKVHVVLYKDNFPASLPAELVACLRDEPMAYAAFLKLNEAEQVDAIKECMELKQTMLLRNELLLL